MMRPAARAAFGLAAVVLVLLLVPPFVAAALPAGPAPTIAFISAPRGPAPTVHNPVVSSPFGASAPRSAVPTPAAAPSVPGPHVLGTKENPYPALGTKWTSSFFNDINVTFTVPYVGGQTFLTAPVRNQIPMESPGFWMNITSLKPIVMANVTIWGWNWPTFNGVTTIAAPIANFPPTVQQGHWPQMLVNTSKNTTASFFFNDYRNFWPGDRIDFNLTVTALNANPATVYSTNVASFPDPVNSTDYATWIVQVGSPWYSPDFNSSIQVATTPNVLGTPAFDPNFKQPLQVELSAVQPIGSSFASIPAGELNYTYSSAGANTSSAVAFTPSNGTSVYLQAPLGPWPGSHVSFQITLWLPWFGGAIDFLKSPVYQFDWSTHGGWPYPNQPLESNLELATYPDALPPANGVVPAGQAVNITLHEPIENISIGSAQVAYTFHDGYGTHSGVLAMQAYSPNTTYVELPGLPPSASVQFAVSAKDVFGDPIFSQYYTYAAAAGTPSYPVDHGFFYFEALDIAGTGFVPFLNYSVSNASWSETGVASSLGFGGPVVPHGISYLTLGFGAYNLQISAFGRSFSTIVNVHNETPFTVVFYVASAAVPLGTTASLPVVTIGTVAGLGAGFLAVFLVWPWFRERRKRIEAEQRRITL